MALLSSGSFVNVDWTAALDSCTSESRARLWALLLRELSTVAKGPLTALAVNEGIPLEKDNKSGAENTFRSPVGLRILHGDFGPSTTEAEMPTTEEFEEALWVSTKQNGIHQIWAPRWTMFSRGNVKEKARLLEFRQPKAGSSTTDGNANRPWAVDLYGGIGYFVFSYAKLGMRVLCWEINPWSVEGLRRGAEANRWTVKVVSDAAALARPAEETIGSGEQIIVFLEDNQLARDKLLRLQSLGIAGSVAHVNGGLLPTSEPTWELAWSITKHSHAGQSWLHLHENVGMHDIDDRRREIEKRFRGWNEAQGSTRNVVLNHVEQVKTFAPGVWHCVFDVCIS